MLADVDNAPRLQADAGHLSYDDNQHSRASKLSAISLKTLSAIDLKRVSGIAEIRSYGRSEHGLLLTRALR